jgi:hypothetical protein
MVEHKAHQKRFFLDIKFIDQLVNYEFRLGYTDITRSETIKKKLTGANQMNKSTSRNVYALNGTPFVLVRGHRLFARSSATAGAPYTRAICDVPRVSEGGITVKVALEAEGGEFIEEIWGGKFGSEHVECTRK